MKREDYISDSQVVKRANAAVKIELDKKKALDIPIAVFDRKTQKIYQKNSDGSKVAIGERIRKGRYSERITGEYFMDKSIAYIINSAPGIGKSTLIKNLHTRLPDGFALIDGDDVGRTNPYENNINWLNVIQDNIVDCCSNFKKYGFSNCIISFVFSAEERLERIKNLLAIRGFKVVHIVLECDENEMCRRIMQRNTSKLINTEQAKKLNQALKFISADLKVNTTLIEADEVADIVINFIAEASFVRAVCLTDNTLETPQLKQ